MGGPTLCALTTQRRFGLTKIKPKSKGCLTLKPRIFTVISAKTREEEEIKDTAFNAISKIVRGHFMCDVL